MPTPGSPATVTSCTDRSAIALSNVPRSSVKSSSRPTSGVVIDRITSEPKRADRPQRPPDGDRLGLPFASIGSSGSYSNTRSVARNVPSPTATPFTGACDWIRAAVLTTSPVTIPSPSSGRASSETTASPVFTPTRTDRASDPSAAFSSSIASSSARPARTARSGSSSCAAGRRTPPSPRRR